MKFIRNQKGIGIIEGLLVIIALTLIVFVGFYVYKANKKTDSSANSSGSSNSAPAEQKPAADQTKYLEIKEFGVKVPLSQDLLDAKYRAEDSTDVNGKPVTYVYVSSDSLDELAKACSDGVLHEESSNFIGLSKQSGTYKSSMDYGGLLKQLDGFFITGSHPNGTPCTSDDQAALDAYINKVADLNKSFTEDFKDAVSTN